jgi:hypothetical protein
MIMTPIVKANSKARLGTIASLLLGAFVFINGQHAAAQTTTTKVGPICRVEYVPQNSTTKSNLIVSLSTADHCFAPHTTHFFCGNFGTAAGSRCAAQYTVYSESALNALYESAVKGMAADLWIRSTGTCQGVPGGTQCFSAQAIFEFPPPPI